jgi:hypothetical protein
VYLNRLLKMNLLSRYCLSIRDSLSHDSVMLRRARVAAFVEVSLPTCLASALMREGSRRRRQRRRASFAGESQRVTLALPA